MKATKKSQYALRAMIILSKKKKEITSLRVIADKEGIPAFYLEKVFSMLKKNNLVESKRGVLGGYFLAREPEKITLKDIFNAVGESVQIVDCFSSKCPKSGNCEASKAWIKVNKKIEETLSLIKLSDLIAGAESASIKI
ncbi:MAG: Rrf2 family transcriptional regulator [Patescibacteria group bacterium]|nr:Rrf2 family transcriptional regulator [Patescibacteria group bacterium]